jgi:hypothetical protein
MAERRSPAREGCVGGDLAWPHRRDDGNGVFTASNTTTMVGANTASGMPIGSGLGCGNSSICRTMS